MKIGIYFFRTLFSQSAGSLSVGKLSAYLHKKGYEVDLHLLSLSDYGQNLKECASFDKYDKIIYKCNFKDYEYGIRLLSELNKNLNIEMYLTGVFSQINRERIEEKKLNFKLFDLQNWADVDENFPKIGEKINKSSIICDIDREIEMKEEGSYINIEASLGCKYRCDFCHINILKLPYFEKSIDSLVDEIEELIKRGKRFFIFNDCVFWKNESDNKRVEEFYEKVKKRGLDFCFYIYLALQPIMPDEILSKLSEIGLVRVFFGVENAAKDFASFYSKNVSTSLAEIMIEKLNHFNISFHIGFILFYKELSYQNLFVNIDYLKSIKKLFRLGILLEKIRILPSYKKEKLLFKNESDKVDIAYNYKFDDEKVSEAHSALVGLLSHIDIRIFEQFFNGITLARAILYKYSRQDDYIKELEDSKKVIEEINDSLYDVIKKVFLNLDYSEKDVFILKTLYAKSEVNYYRFFNKLKKCDIKIAKMLPHGKESYNL